MINDIEGWMNSTDLNWLHSTAQEMDNIIEIGCWKGRSTFSLLSGCKGTVYAIDHFKGTKGEDCFDEAVDNDIFSEFMNNVGHFTNLKVFNGESFKAVGYFKKKSIDMIFIDADHNDLVQDIRSWRPVAKKLICGHDCYLESVRKALRRCFRGYKISGNIWYKELN